jgi:phosphoglycolate phosphatase
VDSQQYIIEAMQHAFANHGLAPPPRHAVAGVIGLSLTEAVLRLLPRANPSERDAVAHGFREHYVRERSAEALYAGVRETLHELKSRGYRMGVVTGKSLRGLLHVMTQHQLDAVFDVWRTADQCPSKPHPAMVEECMIDIGISKARVTVVGDALFDMEMAKASGVRALGVSYGIESADTLRQAGAAGVVDSFSELLEHFPRLGACSSPSARTQGA